MDDYKEQLKITPVGLLEFSELPEIQLSRYIGQKLWPLPMRSTAHKNMLAAEGFVFNSRRFSCFTRFNLNYTAVTFISL